MPVLPYKIQKRFVAQSWYLKQMPILAFLFFAILFLFCFFQWEDCGAESGQRSKDVDALAGFSDHVSEVARTTVSWKSKQEFFGKVLD